MLRSTLNADRFYYPLLTTFIVLTAALIARQVSIDGESLKNTFFYAWLLEDPLTMALVAMGAMMLTWRIVFALRYKPYAPLTDMQLPSLTVIIPAYNEGDQVLPTVRSVMASRYPKRKLQVICIDDGSADDTWDWLRIAKAQFSDNVEIIRQATNQGKRVALMAGFSRAKGDVIITLDSDSEVLPDTLREAVAPFVHDKQVGSVAGNVRVLNIDEGVIPKMMEVSFTSAFDFIRAGQSVYGGVFCTPGALSAYRASVLLPLLEEWSQQTFLGRTAAIGEDRALTNLVLAKGHRVVYARDAIVLTKVPVNYTGLRKMLTRWARSNVRENLVMLRFAFKRFRTNSGGAGWIRLFCVLQLLRMTLYEALKCIIVVRLLMLPVMVLGAIIAGGLIASIVPGVVHRIRYGGLFGFKWAIPFSFFWLVALSWISLWGMFTAANSGWLTRTVPTSKPTPVKLPAAA